MRPLREWIDQASIQTEQELEGHHTTKSSGPMAAAYPPYKHEASIACTETCARSPKWHLSAHQNGGADPNRCLGEAELKRR